MSKIEALSAADSASIAMLSQGTASLEKAKVLANQASSKEAEVEKAASDFEALLLHQMFKVMWETVETTGLFGENSNEGQIYRDMLNQAIAESASQGKGIGVKDMLRKELTKANKASER
ncbi:MAG: rod-binding protein [Deltaproteobacteria bacterium]|nr:rod-binding protein [Deltaproteobacteria bacterium]